MLRPEIALDPCDIYLAAGNQEDEILHGCQRYWIAEAIRYTHREAVEELFTDCSPTSTSQMRSQVVLTDWQDLPLVERLPPENTPLQPWPHLGERGHNKRHIQRHRRNIYRATRIQPYRRL